MKLLITFAILMFTAIGGFAQTDLPIIGKVSDIEGKKKVYLAAATTDERKNMQNLIEKDKYFDVVSDVTNADFILEYKQVSNRAGVNLLGIPIAGSDISELSAYFFNSEKKKVIVWSKTQDKFKQKRWGGPQDNSIFLTKIFLKEIRGKDK